MFNFSWASRILRFLLVVSIQCNNFMWCLLPTTQVVASTIIKYKMLNSLLVLHFIFCFYLLLCYCSNYKILMFQVFCVFFFSIFCSFCNFCFFFFWGCFALACYFAFFLDVPPSWKIQRNPSLQRKININLKT
jgi:hypothetical protein